MYTTFGKAFGVVGAGVSIASSWSTIVVFVENDMSWSSLTTGEQLELVSSALAGIGAIANFLPCVGPIVGASIGTAGCLIGLVSTMFSDNFIAPQMIELKLGNGTKAYVYIT